MSAKTHQTPATKVQTKSDVTRSDKSEIAAFLDAAKRVVDNGAKGRLVLALDATMSRQPTWDLACSIQGQMFDSVDKSTPLNMQLVYFRGYEECRASRWAHSGAQLATMMSRIDCRAGHTQIAKVLRHAKNEHAKLPINAVIYIGDACEEDADTLGHLAGEMGLRNLPVFIFQEGRDKRVEQIYRQIGQLSGGGWFRFDRNAPDVLKDLLASIAIYATGGIKALRLRGEKSDRILLEKLGKAQS